MLNNIDGIPVHSVKIFLGGREYIVKINYDISFPEDPEKRPMTTLKSLEECSVFVRTRSKSLLVQVALVNIAGLYSTK